MGPVVAGILGLVIGAICIRLSKLYFGMLQISLGSLVWAIVYRWYSFTGCGRHPRCPPSRHRLLAHGAYYFTLIVTAVSMFILYRMIRSPFGSALQGIRDNPVRSEMIGVNVKLQQLLALTIAGFSSEAWPGRFLSLWTTRSFPT